MTGRILGIGNDIIEIDRIKKVLERHAERFAERILTPKELDYCLRYAHPAKHIAGRFCAKESIAKALGIGIGRSLNWHDLEILNDTLGKPVLSLSSRMKNLLGNGEIHLSISHCEAYATAVALWSEN